MQLGRSAALRAWGERRPCACAAGAATAAIASVVMSVRVMGMAATFTPPAFNPHSSARVGRTEAVTEMQAAVVRVPVWPERPCSPRGDAVGAKLRQG